MSKIRVIFRKHFDSDGCGDDYPTDFFRPPSGTLQDMTFVEMRPPTSDNEYGEEEWEYEVEPDDEGAVCAALDRCETVASYYDPELPELA